MEKGKGPRLVIRRRKTDRGTLFAFSGEITIYIVKRLRDLLVKCIDKAGSLTVDLSGIHKIDTSGLQLLLAAKRVCEQRNGSLEIAAESKEIRRILDLFGSAL